MGLTRGQSMAERPGALGTPRRLMGAGLLMGASLGALLLNNAVLAPKAEGQGHQAQVPVAYEPSEVQPPGDLTVRMRGALAGPSTTAVRGLTLTLEGAEAQRCSKAELDLTLQQEIQRQYCLRHYTNEDVNLAPYLEPLNFRGPKTSQPGEADAFYPIKLYGYKDGKDIVSNFLRSRGDWERHYMEATVTALGLAGRRRFSLSATLDKAEAEAKGNKAKASEGASGSGSGREGLLFLDIGANVGSHSLFVSAAGYSVVSFEPMPANEWALRSSLCANPDLNQRITFIPKGLGDTPQVCRVISQGINWGDGNILCDPTQPIPGDYILRGQTQTTTLDMTPLHCIQPHSGERRRLAGVKMDVEGFEHHVVRGGMAHFWKTMQVPFINYENDCMASLDDRRAVLHYFLGLGTYRFNCGDTKQGAEVFSTISAAAAADKETFQGPSPEEALIKSCHEIFMYHDDMVVTSQDGQRTYVATMDDPLPLSATAASRVQ